MIRFVDRKEEMKLLNKLRNLENAFVIVYGRRRIGKTRLIEEFLKKKNGISYTAEDTSKIIQIRGLKNSIADYFNDDFLRNQEIKDWSSLFSYISKYNPNKRFYLWIDEFSYLVKNDPSFSSALQKFIDKYLRKSKVFLIVSGSILGIMKKDVLSYSSPLYGRRTKDILLGQLKFKWLKEFLKWKTEDLIKLYMTVGGIPEYLLVASRYKNYENFINEEFFKKDGYFYREPYFLLSMEFKEIKTYFSILNAIAYGKVSPTDIANFVGIKTREIYPYLDLLINFGFVRKIVPVFSNRKSGIYLINDNFLDFWFNLVFKNREMIETESYVLNKKELNTFFGKKFEYLVLDNFNEFFPGYNVGKWWYKDKEIDIVGIKKDKVLLGECKWRENLNPMEVLKNLYEKSKLIKGKKEFVIFAKSFSNKIKSFNGIKVHYIDITNFN